MTLLSGAPSRNRLFQTAHSSTAGLPRPSLDIAVIGLGITCSSGSHAAAYRSLLREMSRRGHRIHFFERDHPLFAGKRDLPHPSFCDVHLYDNVDELTSVHAQKLRYADAVIIGSYVPDGLAVAEWVAEHAQGAIVFYDLDTPMTLDKLYRGDFQYISPDIISELDLYLSISGGPALTRLESDFGARRAVPLYTSVDTDEFYPLPVPLVYDLGYNGRYRADSQPALHLRMIEAARRWDRGRFVVAGAGYPDHLNWPSNVERTAPLSTSMRRRFYNAQRFALNISRPETVVPGHALSLGLLEAAACGTPVISDCWPGLETFFEPGSEVLVADSPADTLKYLQTIGDEEAVEIGRAARRRVLESHTTAHRAAELESHLVSAIANVTAQP